MYRYWRVKSQFSTKKLSLQFSLKLGRNASTKLQLPNHEVQVSKNSIETLPWQSPFSFRSVVTSVVTNRNTSQKFKISWLKILAKKMTTTHIDNKIFSRWRADSWNVQVNIIRRSLIPRDFISIYQKTLRVFTLNTKENVSCNLLQINQMSCRVSFFRFIHNSFTCFSTVYTDSYKFMGAEQKTIRFYVSLN